MSDSPPVYAVLAAMEQERDRSHYCDPGCCQTDHHRYRKSGGCGTSASAIARKGLSENRRCNKQREQQGTDHGSE